APRRTRPGAWGAADPGGPTADPRDRRGLARRPDAPRGTGLPHRPARRGEGGAVMTGTTRTDTVDLHYVSRGPDDAATVFLGASIGTDWRLWRAQLDALSGRFRVVAFDTPGPGPPPGTPGGVPVADLARHVRAAAGPLLGPPLGTVRLCRPRPPPQT